MVEHDGADGTVTLQTMAEQPSAQGGPVSPAHFDTPDGDGDGLPFRAKHRRRRWY